MSDTATEVSPFVPGARVAITDGYSDSNWREGFVEKVHKTGRFTLKDGHGAQWRPEEPSRHNYGYKYWRAYKTGGAGYRRDSLRIWDAEADREIKEIFAKQERKKRHRALRERLDRVHESELTDAMLDQIEAALPPLTTGKRE